MLSALLVSLREGLEAALVVGICLSYLRKMERRELEPPVWYGLGAALLASLALAAGLEKLAWNPETLEGVLLLGAAFLLLTMILWMRRLARSLRAQIETRVSGFAARGGWAAVGLFLFVFLMVLREGVETVLLLSALALNSAGMLWLLGTGLGLALAVALGVSFFRGTLPIRLDRFFDASSLMLTLVALQLTLLGVHELAEAEVIPAGPRMMSWLGPIVRHDVFFFVLLLAAAAWIVARELLHRRHAAPLPGGLSPAEQLTLRSRQRRERRWMVTAALTASAALLALTADYVYARGEGELAPVLPVRASSQEVRIPVFLVSDGALHRFRFLENGESVHFLVLRQPDGHLATALEACRICGAHGYTQRGNSLVCGNCAAEIPVAYLDTPGGCTPIPLASHREGAELVIPVAELLRGERFFRRP